MQFDSASYVVLLLVGVSGFWLFRRRPLCRALLLLVCSLIFYMSSNWQVAHLLLGITFLDYVSGLVIAATEVPWKRRLLLMISMAGNLGVLFYFKYFNFVGSNLAALGSLLSGEAALYQPRDIFLPAGISFYTFQSMSYTIDVYRRRIPATRSLLDFTVFVIFFPQLVAGPIVRAATFLPQLLHRPRWAPRRMTRGLFLVVVGVCKKILFADLLGMMIVDRVYRDPSGFGSIDSLLAFYGYSMQIYFDFSAYSDIAIGSAAMMGLRLPANFRHPFLATDPSDLWRRWHISLSTWLRDYLYIPLGGNRRGWWRTQFNLMATMLLGGLWHGAHWNFVFWGGLHGLYLFVQRLVERFLPAGRGLRAAPRWLKIAFMFHLTCFTFVFFRARTMDQAWTLLSNIFAGPGDTSLRYQHWILPATVLVLLGHLMSQRWLPSVQRAFMRTPELMVAGALVLITGALGLVSYGQRPFIYFQF